MTKPRYFLPWFRLARRRVDIPDFPIYSRFAGVSTVVVSSAVFSIPRVPYPSSWPDRQISAPGKALWEDMAGDPAKATKRIVENRLGVLYLHDYLATVSDVSERMANLDRRIMLKVSFRSQIDQQPRKET